MSACKGQNNPEVYPSSVPLRAGERVGELSNSVWIVFQAANGVYWFGSDKDGLFQYDGKTLIQYTTKHGLSSNQVRSIQEDRHGNIYCATLGGINKFDGKYFSLLEPIISKSADENWKLQPDDLWFSILGKNGQKGPYRYDGKNLYQLQFPKHYLADDYFRKYPNNAWSPYEVYTIYKDSKGNIWMGTGNFGICRYDGHSLSWLYEDHLTNTPNGGSFGIRSILEDQKGQFWFCNSRYRYHILPDIKKDNGKVLINYWKEKGMEDISSVDGNYTYFLSITEDSSGVLWMATYNEGVWRYNGKEAINYPLKAKGKSITIFSIYKDRKGIIWLGTHNNGAYRFNGDEFEPFRP